MNPEVPKYGIHTYTVDARRGTFYEGCDLSSPKMDRHGRRSMWLFDSSEEESSDLCSDDEVQSMFSRRPTSPVITDALANEQSQTVLDPTASQDVFLDDSSTSSASENISDAGSFTGSASMGSGLSVQQDDDAKVMLINITGLRGNSAWLFDVSFPEYVTVLNFSFNSDLLAAATSTVDTINSAAQGLVELIKQSVDESGSYVCHLSETSICCRQVANLGNLRILPLYFLPVISAEPF